MLRGELAWLVITPQVCGLSILMLGVAGWKWFSALRA